MSRTTSAWRRSLAGEGEAWLFALRTAFAVLLALWVAFRLDLNSPSSAAISAVIVALPRAGQVIEKAMFRLLGTVIGAVAALVMLALFIQQPSGLLVAMALWIGGCVALSQLTRNQRAYAFVLSGYTVVIIAYPAYLDPGHALNIAVDRAAAVCVGVVSATLTSALLLPSSAAAQMIADVRRRLPDLVGLARLALTEPMREPATATTDQPSQRAAVRRGQEALVRDILALEATRGASSFEDAESRIRGADLQRLNAAFLASSTALHALHRTRETLVRDGQLDVDAALVRLLGDLLNCVVDDAGQLPARAVDAGPALMRVEAFIEDWAGQAARAAYELEPRNRPTFATVQRLALWFAQDLRDYLQRYVRLRKPARDGTPTVAFAAPWDPVLTLAAGLRVVFVILASGAAWMALGWADGFYGFMQACVFPGLFAAAPNPVAVVRQVSGGFVIGFLLTAPLFLGVMPLLDGYAELALALLPVLLLGGYWIAKPATTGRGLGMLLMLFVGTMITNSIDYDVAAFLNRVISTLIGFGIVAFVLTVLPLTRDPWVLRRLRRALRTQLEVAAFAPLPEARTRFESGAIDLLLQLVSRQAGDDHATRRDFEHGLAILEAGYALLRLREAGETDPAALRARLAQLDRGVVGPPPSAADDTAPSRIDALGAATADALLQLAAHSLHRPQPELVHAR